MSLRKKKHSKITSPDLKALLLSLDDYLDQRYLFRSAAHYKGWLGKLRAFVDSENVEKAERANSGERLWQPQVWGSDPDALAGAVEWARREHLKNNFSTALMRLIEARGLDPVQVYKRACIDRKLFSKIKTNPDYLPGKKTVLALALALELDLQETQNLLKMAGFALSNYILFDVIIEYFITHGIYDMDAINAALYTYDQPVFQ